MLFNIKKAFRARRVEMSAETETVLEKQLSNLESFNAIISVTFTSARMNSRATKTSWGKDKCLGEVLWKSRIERCPICLKVLNNSFCFLFEQKKDKQIPLIHEPLFSQVGKKRQKEGADNRTSFKKKLNIMKKKTFGFDMLLRNFLHEILWFFHD